MALPADAALAVPFNYGVSNRFKGLSSDRNTFFSNALGFPGRRFFEPGGREFESLRARSITKIFPHGSAI
jgi:hypothetical protein